MNLNDYTIHRFSKVSFIPKTTLLDLCSGKTSINKSQTVTIQKIARTLEQPNNNYLELNIPDFLHDSIFNFKNNINGELYDIYYCTLQSY